MRNEFLSLVAQVIEAESYMCLEFRNKGQEQHKIKYLIIINFVRANLFNSVLKKYIFEHNE